MGVILGREYSDTRENDNGDTEYLLSEEGEWLDEEEISELDYWLGDYTSDVEDENYGGLDWSDS